MGIAIPLFDDRHHDAFFTAVRLVEALLFAAREPLPAADLAARLPTGVDARRVLQHVARDYANRGVNLVECDGRWSFRTALDLGHLLARERVEPRRLSRAGMETLAIIAYHQPVTRAEIEEIRGVGLSKGTLGLLMEAGWIRPRGRRRTPGRPLTYGTTTEFLNHFSLSAISDLPGLDDLKAAGFFESPLPPGFRVPAPAEGDLLQPDEDPLNAFPAMDEDEESMEPSARRSSP